MPHFSEQGAGCWLLTYHGPEGVSPRGDVTSSDPFPIGILGFGDIYGFDIVGQIQACLLC